MLPYPVLLRPKSLQSLGSIKSTLITSSSLLPSLIPSSTVNYRSYLSSNLLMYSTQIHEFTPETKFCAAISGKKDLVTDPESSPDSESKGRRRGRPKIAAKPQKEDENSGKTTPITIPRKPRRGRRSEAIAVEDFVRDSLERTFATIQQQHSVTLESKENILKERVSDETDSDTSGDDSDDNSSEKAMQMVVDEDNLHWPLDADVGWGIRASEYFEKHPIKNVVGEDGVEIDWEGEIDDNWVQEINCLEWESFAFHPAPLIVLVFERYNRAADNWKLLKEIEQALKVYWNAKDRLPPRAVKLDINIERDLAYALKVTECPQILFLRGNRILYREKEFRSADELFKLRM
ncbi:hypothetical protein Nepgr_029673 [Nepenthes gracilis]|uniref:Thioredoxin-like fold domain-containing protein MRL7, chloroplastic n=1 Tax=Nepenthes gracilis TaxID=150966 RepID=A0AAD3TCY8_NEPGR|nr:hypothetical protein Nepgr_029673 [Nepenthes gracilis]